MVKKIYSKFQFLIETKEEPFTKVEGNFQIPPSQRFKNAFLPLTNFTMVEEIFQILPSSML